MNTILVTGLHVTETITENTGTMLHHVNGTYYTCIAVLGRRRLNIYFYHALGGQQNVSVISVTAFTSISGLCESG